MVILNNRNSLSSVRNRCKCGPATSHIPGPETLVNGNARATVTAVSISLPGKVKVAISLTPITPALGLTH